MSKGSRKGISNCSLLSVQISVGRPTYLLVLWVLGANDIEPAFAANDGAAVAELLDRRAHLHSTLLGCCRCDCCRLLERWCSRACGCVHGGLEHGGRGGRGAASHLCLCGHSRAQRLRHNAQCCLQHLVKYRIEEGVRRMLGVGCLARKRLVRCGRCRASEPERRGPRFGR